MKTLKKFKSQDKFVTTTHQSHQQHDFKDSLLKRVHDTYYQQKFSINKASEENDQHFQTVSGSYDLTSIPTSSTGTCPTACNINTNPNTSMNIQQYQYTKVVNSCNQTAIIGKIQNSASGSSPSVNMRIESNNTNNPNYNQQIGSKVKSTKNLTKSSIGDLSLLQLRHNANQKQNQLTFKSLATSTCHSFSNKNLTTSFTSQRQKLQNVLSFNQTSKNLRDVQQRQSPSRVAQKPHNTSQLTRNQSHSKKREDQSLGLFQEKFNNNQSTSQLPNSNKISKPQNLNVQSHKAFQQVVNFRNFNTIQNKKSHLSIEQRLNKIQSSVPTDIKLPTTDQSNVIGNNQSNQIQFQSFRTNQLSVHDQNPQEDDAFQGDDDRPNSSFKTVIDQRKSIENLNNKSKLARNFIERKSPSQQQNMPITPQKKKKTSSSQLDRYMSHTNQVQARLKLIVNQSIPNTCAFRKISDNNFQDIDAFNGDITMPNSATKEINHSRHDSVETINKYPMKLASSCTLNAMNNSNNSIKFRSTSPRTHFDSDQRNIRHFQNQSSIFSNNEHKVSYRLKINLESPCGYDSINTLPQKSEFDEKRRSLAMYSISRTKPSVQTYNQSRSPNSRGNYNQSSKNEARSALELEYLQHLSYFQEIHANLRTQQQKLVSKVKDNFIDIDLLEAINTSLNWKINLQIRENNDVQLFIQDLKRKLEPLKEELGDKQKVNDKEIYSESLNRQKIRSNCQQISRDIQEKQEDFEEFLYQDESRIKLLERASLNQDNRFQLLKQAFKRSMSTGFPMPQESCEPDSFHNHERQNVFQEQKKRQGNVFKSTAMQFVKIDLTDDLDLSPSDENQQLLKTMKDHPSTFTQSFQTINSNSSTVKFERNQSQNKFSMTAKQPQSSNKPELLQKRKSINQSNKSASSQVKNVHQQSTSNLRSSINNCISKLGVSQFDTKRKSHNSIKNNNLSQSINVKL
eukprot:403358330